MSEDIRFVLDEKTIEKLHAYGELLEKEPAVMLDEALRLYFDTQDKLLLEQGMTEIDPQTDLGFDEFWEGFED